MLLWHNVITPRPGPNASSYLWYTSRGACILKTLHDHGTSHKNRTPTKRGTDPAHPPHCNLEIHRPQRASSETHRERVGGESVARPGQVEEHHRGHGVGGRDLREGVGGRAAKQPSEVLKRRRFDQRGEKSPRGLLHAPRSDQAGALQMLGNDGVRALVVRARLWRERGNKEGSKGRGVEIGYTFWTRGCTSAVVLIN